jgi:CheY-like chemotaxis protein
MAAATIARRPEPRLRDTVLVIDDEPTLRMLVAEVLEDSGYTAIEADGPAGLRVLQSAARIDVLITDVQLPAGMNGRQMFAAGRAARPDLRVLFITGFEEATAIANGELDAGMQVLTKPFTIDALSRKIRTIVAG